MKKLSAHAKTMMGYIVALVLCLIIVATLVPYGIGILENATFPAGTPSIVKIMFSTIIEIFVAIAIILIFFEMIPKGATEKLGIS